MDVIGLAAYGRRSGPAWRALETRVASDRGSRYVPRFYSGLTGPSRRVR